MNTNVPSSEDCLYLSLYVPEKVDSTRKLAVLVWVYGGGFWSGSATLDVYDGKIFSSEEDVIIVAMNYRVQHGSLDQLLALKWVHTNIEVFGGDPNRITLFGESAGAASVSMHMISQRSIPYFQRAIIQSGSAVAPWALENRQVALHRSVVLYDSMKCANTSSARMDNLAPEQWNMEEVWHCLMNASAEKIRNLSDSEWAPVTGFADFPWVPKTQLLAGSNLDESIYFVVYQLADVFPPAEFFDKNKHFINSREVWLKSISNLLPRQMLKSSLALQAILHEYEPMELPVPPKAI
uniref:Carboxylic ester hydrolase n=1 Tax=Ditylenchus dipsaci TaxID=166011 RepID=A0A915CYS2_9BILA